MHVLAQAASTIDEVLAWHPHWDIWATVFVLAFGYWYLIRRIAPHVLGPDQPAVSRRQVVSYSLGVLILWGVSDWPFHDIAEESLFMFHMTEHLALGLIVPPLLLAGIPRWMARHLIGGPRMLPIVRRLAKAVPAFFIFNILIVGIHWPQIVTLMVTNELAHFLVHTVLFLAALLVWMPVFSPLPEVPRLPAPVRMLYLFLHSLLPTVPASFLTFGTEPIYPTYVDAPRLWGLSAIADQTLAGLIMKLGGGLILWGIIAVMWFRWFADEQRWDQLEDQLRRTP